MLAHYDCENIYLVSLTIGTLTIFNHENQENHVFVARLALSSAPPARDDDGGASSYFGTVPRHFFSISHLNCANAEARRRTRGQEEQLAQLLSRV